MDSSDSFRRTYARRTRSRRMLGIQYHSKGEAWGMRGERDHPLKVRPIRRSLLHSTMRPKATSQCRERHARSQPLSVTLGSGQISGVRVRGTKSKIKMHDYI